MLLTKRLSRSYEKKDSVHKCENVSHFHHANCYYCNKILIRLHLELLHTCIHLLCSRKQTKQIERSYVIGCSIHDAEKFSGNFKFMENFKWEISKERERERCAACDDNFKWKFRWKILIIRKQSFKTRIWVCLKLKVPFLKSNLIQISALWINYPST